MKDITFADRLTEHARTALLTASDLARERNHTEVTMFHVLYAIATQKGSAGANMLTTLSLTPEVLMPFMGDTPPKKRSIAQPRISKKLKEVLVRAYKTAGKTGHPYIGTEHIVHAILEMKDPNMNTILQKIDSDAVPLKNVGQIPFNDVPLSQLTQFLSGDASSMRHAHNDPTALESFATEFSNNAAKVLIGRDATLNHIITVLSRKEKSNPLLIGDPGVGKTAIVEGLAQRIVSGDVPAHLMNARILTLDLADIVAGTTYRGEFEARLKEIITEASNDPTVILFIDEIHMIVGAGNTQGSLDVANILKPALSRGLIRIIGATTQTEYKKHISKDTALARRFQIISVDEPTRDECITILSGAKKYYEDFHNITISDDVLEHVVDWSMRYLPARHLPDKAFDILDEAAAYMRANAKNARHHKDIIFLERDYAKVVEQKNHAIATEDYDTALLLRRKESTLLTKIETQKKSLVRKNSPQKLTLTEVARATALLAKIPEHKILNNTPSRILKSLNEWQREIIGQTDATNTIKATLMRSFAGLTNQNRPSGSFLFLGPTGVGKTFAATTLAQKVFEKTDALIRIDMSELSEKHTVSKLLGAPAGYIGHGDGGTLTEQIRRNPYSVVLFDEIEKAHPDTLNILLQILEDGTVTDATGQKADFRHSIIILTSNIGTHALTQSARIGFEQNQKDKLHKNFAHTKSDVLIELRETIKPEILNRLDNVLVFMPLTESALTKIARKELSLRANDLKKQGIMLKIAPSIAKFIAKNAHIDIYDGARGIRRAINTYIDNSLAEEILAHPQRPLRLSCTVTDDTIKIAQTKK